MYEKVRMSKQWTSYIQGIYGYNETTIMIQLVWNNYYDTTSIIQLLSYN